MQQSATNPAGDYSSRPYGPAALPPTLFAEHRWRQWKWRSRLLLWLSDVKLSVSVFTVVSVVVVVPAGGVVVTITVCVPAGLDDVLVLVEVRVVVLYTVTIFGFGFDHAWLQAEQIRNLDRRGNGRSKGLSQRGSGGDRGCGCAGRRGFHDFDFGRLRGCARYCICWWSSCSHGAGNGHGVGYDCGRLVCCFGQRLKLRLRDQSRRVTGTSRFAVAITVMRLQNLGSSTLDIYTTPNHSVIAYLKVQ
ncbi:uncharacterized protein CC84DRAFT_1180663 [Paraphaeosphaeria sporulosa]|uniref:Uncharacterized protein n=1 Tax=Paraphaeosphaeria sporulosa TaxID=1460663 RepID=A0A177BZP2_9PLEO|nr:uncharacterized protein CC84DRAFT_1180663 [Paraphaeosphaeria sporulosa]OAG00685.1 hypothetical protein CC84DRAFT_1180663 [Paraphaeosphaeria sporulosa]